jgi:hypothetical protein
MAWSSALQRAYTSRRPSAREAEPPLDVTEAPFRWRWKQVFYTHSLFFDGDGSASRMRRGARRFCDAHRRALAARAPPKGDTACTAWCVTRVVTGSW